MRRILTSLIALLIITTTAIASMLVNPYRFVSGEFNPITDVTSATCEAWWDASDSSTITESSGLISGWADKTSNNYDWSQTNTPDKPTYSTSYLNGLNAVFFNNDSEYMTLASKIAISQPATIFIVSEAVTENVGSYILFDTAADYILLANNLGRLSVTYGNQGLQAFAYDADPLLTRVYVNGSSTEVRNRLVSSGTVNAGTNDVDISSLGWQFNNQNHYVMEIIVYDDTLSAGDITAVENYLRGKWGAGI